jgi:tetratricopeptide (TPR) repeat protein
MSSLWQRARIALRDRDSAALLSLEKELQAAGTSLEAPVRNALSAQFAFAKGDEAGARRLLISASKKRPLDPREKLVLGFLLVDDAPKARKLFSAAGKGFKDPRIPEGLGTTMVDMGELEPGLKMLQRAVKDDPASWSARFALGMARVIANQPAEAREDFEAVVRMRPDYEPAWLGFAAQAIAIGKAAEASQVLGKLLQVAPDREKLLLAYVDCLVHAGDVPKALAALTPLTNASRDPGLLLDYVELCLSGGFLEPAAQTLAKIEKLAPQEGLVWVLKGQVCERQPAPDLEEALAAYEKALQLDSESARAQNALGLLLMSQTPHEDIPRAAVLLKAASTATGPAGGASLCNLALLHLGEGRVSEAKKYAQKALAHDGTAPATRGQAERILQES